MFATSLLPLSSPPISLLPTSTQQSLETTPHPHSPHAHSRRKAGNRLNTPLASVAHNERLIASRKLAIAMYGYSWLKPAGCTKTMLGRREEELEREEVERQLREVELQERMATEQEEQERRDELGRQAEAGEVEGVGERDLDDDVPDADEGEDSGEEEEDVEDASEADEEEDDDDDDMEGDLDDEIPSADDHESSWVYDTRREPDTESEDDEGSSHASHRSDNDDAATEALVNAMLDEDELGTYTHPDVDMDGNLSDAVPEASPGWEHTDSELSDSSMDISLLPAAQTEEIRRVSGNRMLPPPFPPSLSRPQPRRAVMQTPTSEVEVSALISSADTTGEQRRGWLHPASARRNLFGGLRGVPVQGVRPGAGDAGLFTPSPRQGDDEEDQEEQEEQMRSRTRSGRLLQLGGLRGGRRRGDET